LRTTDKMVLFWGDEDIYSNFFPSAFTIDNVTYRFVEQFMMASKARCFGDYTSERKIMAESVPLAIKRLGRGVQGYVEEVWVAQREDIVFQACLAKFQQNPVLAQQLLETGDRILVEASPYDRIWGVGLGEKDPRALDPNKWRGQNLLGKVLMRVRAVLRGQVVGTASAPAQSTLPL
jgi:ribA/ribD-fused uncharacterized protein